MARSPKLRLRTLEEKLILVWRVWRQRAVRIIVDLAPHEEGMPREKVAPVELGVPWRISGKSTVPQVLKPARRGALGAPQGLFLLAGFP